MHYIEEVRDLFSVGQEYYIGHCISSDFKLGKGIAVLFDRYFNMRERLFQHYPNYHTQFKKNNCQGDVLLVGRVFNLVTKEYYYQKPTYRSLEQALWKLRALCIGNNISYLALPRIGSGLDRLSWGKVSTLIKQIFLDVEINILICSL